MSEQPPAIPPLDAATEEAAAAANAKPAAAKPAADGDAVYYAVRRGRTVRGCIFLHWDDARLQVENFPSGEYGEFDDLTEAAEYVRAGGRAAARMDDADVTAVYAAGAAAEAYAAVKASGKKRVTPTSALRAYKKRRTSASTTPKSGKKGSKANTTPIGSRSVEKQKRKPYKQWERTFTELKEHRDKTGSFDILGPDDDDKKKLRRWVTDQRALYKSYVEGRDSAMTAEKVKRLEDIGFDFEYSPSSTPGGGAAKRDGGGGTPGGRQGSDRKRRPYKQWEEMFSKLTQYKDENGTCRIDRKDKDHNDLRLWCNEQRCYYRTMKAGKPSAMSDEKVTRLTDLGFDFMHFTWDERMDQLKQFKEERGHLNIPGDHPTLGKWARKVRVQYRDMANPNKAAAAEGKGGESDDEADDSKEKAKQSISREPLTREQFDQLTKMGFKPTRRKAILDDAKEREVWDRGFEALLLYKAEHGDCKVSTTPPHTDLTRWVLAQRREYQKLKDGKDSLLTAARLQKLNDVGFVFRQKKDYISWAGRMEMLRQYKEVHGHVRIPVSDPNLGWFVSAQREEYRKRTDGLSSSLTDERMQDLTDLGFVFLAGKRKGTQTTPRKTWEERFDELMEFKAEYGHCVVPQHYPGLGYWVHSQRNNYRKLKQGKTCALTAEKALKLADVGFVFDAMKKKGVGGGGGGGAAAGDVVVGGVAGGAGVSLLSDDERSI